MTDLRKIKELAENEFDSFLENLHEENPHLLLKYQLTREMKNEFIEAAVKQFWTQKAFDLEEVLKFTLERHKQLMSKRV